MHTPQHRQTIKSICLSDFRREKLDYQLELFRNSDPSSKTITSLSLSPQSGLQQNPKRVSGLTKKITLGLFHRKEK